MEKGRLTAVTKPLNERKTQPFVASVPSGRKAHAPAAKCPIEKKPIRSDVRIARKENVRPATKPMGRNPYENARSHASDATKGSMFPRMKETRCPSVNALRPEATKSASRAIDVTKVSKAPALKSGWFTSFEVKSTEKKTSLVNAVKPKTNARSHASDVSSMAVNDLWFKSFNVKISEKPARPADKKPLNAVGSKAFKVPTVPEKKNVRDECMAKAHDQTRTNSVAKTSPADYDWSANTYDPFWWKKMDNFDSLFPGPKVNYGMGSF